MPDKAELKQLLQERNEHPERSTEIDQHIRSRFEQDCAILVLDLSGFSRLTIRHGIIHFLAIVHRMTRSPHRSSIATRAECEAGS
jgi:uncharacterized protein (DUF924 family)